MAIITKSESKNESASSDLGVDRYGKRPASDDAAPAAKAARTLESEEI
ncbi:MAG UNVERIFIED_CONTAM: hypothetical protein LVQ98_03685 [Rickettsiaceae bacterium]|jgi:hypothetical protein